ncbi:transmembrane protein 14Cb [Electrophorus electricus]|uniref:Transmembrane protein 14C n=1 Tax=Electrophorus electricus TaxID=8005 RepID=A0A4W4EX21_ELEEL|nr:transmembrane protein 14Cb [Electrophorus electricus]
MAIDWIGYGYAASIATGGAIGYIKAGSSISLFAGLLFGILATFGAFQRSQDPKNVWVLLGTYGTMSAVMGVRFLSSWKVMPAGLIAGASLLMILRLGVGFLQTKKNA